MSGDLILYFSRAGKTVYFNRGAAVIESHLVAKIPLLQYPGIPWNLDVLWMALVYVGIGYFYKSLIREIIEDDSMCFDMLVVGIAIILGIFGFFNYREGYFFYYFDMKPVYYKELLSAILIPCSFGIVLVRGVHGLVRIKCLNRMRKLSELCGRATIPIMFMHMLLNHWQNT